LKGWPVRYQVGTESLLEEGRGRGEEGHKKRGKKNLGEGDKEERNIGGGGREET